MKLTAQERLGARILIVDDQPANVSLLEAMLEEAGYTQVTSTMEPDKVCAMHRKTPFDLILLDLQMPTMDGFQVMDSLKASTAEDDYLPVLVITAQPGHKLRALQAGAKDFVSKPFDMVEVKARIHNLIEVRLLHRKLAQHNIALERQVQERTAELRESEARYRGLTELATDWYWEQDGEGRFTKVSGPVLEMLGLQVEALNDDSGHEHSDDGWNPAERQRLQARIAARSPFLDMVLSRELPGGGVRQYRVSGTPMFDSRCTLIGYRGFGVEMLGSTK
ncbi:PAS/PAC sensor protein [Hydrogenophaga taeniospiralis CCUG 15921]|uniref:PAS/PAC sensor protein n=1 Tax=Hydrogenophaga taeniospiralis CCUG 15921 TaxID=1281780 RepID=A0A9X4S9M8_9BURK|nr:response regulator [Hydrogenophaga taeniospiralis]MDG5977792.1 PAS/PAC sensor protein [Hydrogenophaga taeniospiralis CCUG 15921]